MTGIVLTAATEPGIAAETARLAELLQQRAGAGFTSYYEPRPELEHGNIFRRAFPAALVKVLAGKE